MRGRAARCKLISYARHQFPAEIIRHAVWLYLRFTLSYRDVEELLAERGIETSYETVRRWFLKFGPKFAHNLRRLRPKPTATVLDGGSHLRLGPVRPSRVLGHRLARRLLAVDL